MQHTVVIAGVPYLDGGCSTKIPYPWAVSEGFKKIVVVKTREWNYRRKEEKLHSEGSVYVIQNLLPHEFNFILIILQRPFNDPPVS